MSHRRKGVKTHNPTALSPAFMPRAKLEARHTLISDHMQTHYRRISSAKAATNTRPPVSMLKSIVATEQRKDCVKRCSHDDEATGTIVPPSSQRHVQPLIVHYPSPGYHGSSGAGPSDSERWRHYTTKTGQLTGYINATRTRKANMGEGKQNIWKPTFSLNNTATSAASPPPNQQFAHDNKHSSKDTTANDIETPTQPSVGVNEDTMSTSVEQVDLTRCEQRNYRKWTQVLTPSSGDDGEQTDDNGRVEPNRKKLLQESQEELKYLNFILGITDDILRRQVVSDAALQLLINTHIEHNQQKLNKEKMIKRAAELKKQLGFRTS